MPAVQNDNLIENQTFTDNDTVVGYSAGNLRTRAWSGSAISAYMKTRVSPTAIIINTTTNVITLTLGDGTVITGTVTS